jgi:hypothetical protein
VRAGRIDDGRCIPEIAPRMMARVSLAPSRRRWSRCVANASIGWRQVGLPTSAGSVAATATGAISRWFGRWMPHGASPLQNRDRHLQLATDTQSPACPPARHDDVAFDRAAGNVCGLVRACERPQPVYPSLVHLCRSDPTQPNADEVATACPGHEKRGIQLPLPEMSVTADPVAADWRPAPRRPWPCLDGHAPGPVAGQRLI